MAPRSQARSVGAWPTWGGGGGGTTEPGQISRGLADMGGGGGGTTEPGQISRGLADMGGAPRSQARSVGAWPTWGWHHGGGGGGTTEPGQISRGLADMGDGTTEPGQISRGLARSQARSVGAWPTWGGGVAPRSQTRSV